MLRVTGLCAGNSPVTGEFPAQMASNSENVSIWWRYHATKFRATTWFQNPNLKSGPRSSSMHHIHIFSWWKYHWLQPTDVNYVYDQSNMLDHDDGDDWCHCSWLEDIMSGSDIDGLVQEGRNSIVNALEQRMSCTNPSLFIIAGLAYQNAIF